MNKSSKAEQRNGHQPLREGSEDKELGERLIINIDKYKAHPDCKKLYCI